MLLLSIASAHGPMCNDWSECLADLQAGDVAHRADWVRAANRVCDLEHLEACAFVSVADPLKAQDVAGRVANLREAACRNGEVHWCRHAISGALYVRVGNAHAVFDGGSPAWLSMADGTLAKCSGEDCLPALAWSLERSHRLCGDLGCQRTAEELRGRICHGGFELACVKPSNKHLRLCERGKARACLDLALTTLDPLVFTSSLGRSAKLGEPQAVKLVELIFQP